MDAVSCSLQGTRSQLVITASHAVHDQGQQKAEQLSVSSSGSLEALTISACPTHMHSLLPALQALLPAKAPRQVSADTPHLAASSSPAPAQQDLQAAMLQPGLPGATSSSMSSSQAPPQTDQHAVDGLPPAAAQRAEAASVSSAALQWNCCLTGQAPWLLQLVDEAGQPLAGVRTTGIVVQARPHLQQLLLLLLYVTS